MSYAFVLWTLQRTGGTTLMNLLSGLSEHRAAEHEPFNYEASDKRQFGNVYPNWIKTRSVNRLVEICRGHVLIKHVYDKFDDDFNASLASASYRAGYRQIHLMRRDDLARLASKGIAKAEGTWYPGDDVAQIFAEVRSGRRQLQPLDVHGLMREHRLAQQKQKKIVAIHRKRLRCHTVFYEDICTGPSEERLAGFFALTDFLGIDRNKVARNREMIEYRLMSDGQNTAMVLPYLPNLAELQTAVQGMA